jgi:hypothetical protein
MTKQKPPDITSGWFFCSGEEIASIPIGDDKALLPLPHKDNKNRKKNQGKRKTPFLRMGFLLGVDFTLTLSSLP